MFPQDIEAWLRSNVSTEYAAHVTASREATIQALNSLGIDENSELAHLYLHFGPDAVRGWYELLQADSISVNTAYAHEELGVPRHFLAITGIEGDGITLYDTRSGAIFDVEYGKFGDLAAGALEPVATSVAGFIRWCMNR
jgi:hypothetical protein